MRRDSNRKNRLLIQKNEGRRGDWRGLYVTRRVPTKLDANAAGGIHGSSRIEVAQKRSIFVEGM